MLAIAVLSGVLVFDLISEKSKDHVVGRDKVTSSPQFGLPQCLVDGIRGQFDDLRGNLGKDIKQALDGGITADWTAAEKAEAMNAGDNLLQKASREYTAVPSSEDLAMEYRGANLALNKKIIDMAESKGILLRVDDPKGNTRPAQTLAPRGGGDISKIVKAIHLSKITMTGIKQNLFWAFIYNIVGIPLAGGLFYPIFGWLLNPVFAGLAMAFSSVSVVGNSLRLKAKKI